jgi:hypothetical protein
MERAQWRFDQPPLRKVAEAIAVQMERRLLLARPMRRRLPVVLALLLLGAGSAVAGGPATRGRPAPGREASARSSAVLLRATKIFYQRLARARARKEVALERLNRHAFNGKFGGIRFVDKDIHEMARSLSKEEYLRRNPRNALQVEYAENQINEIDAILASLPGDTAGGFRLGSLWDNKWLRAETKGTLSSTMGYIRRQVEREETPQAISSRIGALEAMVIRRMDDTYRAEQPELQARLKSLPPQRLLDHALDLIADIDRMTDRKDVRGEEIARGSSTASSTARGAAKGGAAAYGLLGGVKVAGRLSGSFESSSSETSSFSVDQLILQARTYRVRVRSIDRRIDHLNDADALTPIEARALVGHLVEVHDVVRALERDPDRAKIVSDWLEHSEVIFEFPPGTVYGERATETKVQIGHPHLDARALRGTGVVSDDFAGQLKKHAVDEPVLRRVEGGNPLLVD